MISALMIQGTTSDAGKTTLVAGLGRALARRGARVTPFKPQNMALNSAVTADGREIGRAQALQAQACGLAPHVDMNPVLLKPASDTGAQVIVHGKAIGNMDARAYHAYKPTALAAVMASYQRLCERFDYVLVEGAGSPAEINLRDGDIANMGFAEAADCPVILIADIDKGGVFAHLVGTLACLSRSERSRVSGFVINKFRGDRALLAPGLDWIAGKTGKPVHGVLPYWQDLRLDAEDAVGTAQSLAPGTGHLRVVVPVPPRISNHTDFDPLRHHSQVDLHYVGPGMAIPGADLVILPGSKNVLDDLRWLREQGWQAALERHLRYGGRVLGICGGFQMLGHAVRDPDGVEGASASAAGFAFLDVDTRLTADKRLNAMSGTLVGVAGAAAVTGYEIHCGVTTGSALARPAVAYADGANDGAVSEDGQIVGTYLHGIFDGPQACRALLEWAGLRDPAALDPGQLREEALDRLADGIEDCMALDALFPGLERRASPIAGRNDE